VILLINFITFILSLVFIIRLATQLLDQEVNTARNYIRELDLILAKEPGWVPSFLSNFLA